MKEFLIEKCTKEIEQYEKAIKMASTDVKYDFAIINNDEIVYIADYALRSRLQDIIIPYLKSKMHEAKKELRRLKDV